MHPTKLIEDITVDTNYVNITKLESGQVYQVSVVTSINMADGSLVYNPLQ